MSTHRTRDRVVADPAEVLQGELLDRALDATSVGIAVFDTDLRFVRVNPALAAIDRLPVEAHLGRTMAEVLGPAGRALEPVIHQVLRSGRPVNDLEFSGAPDGDGEELRFFQVSYLPLWGGAPRPTAVLAMVVETTYRMRAESEREARARAQARLRLLVSASDAMTGERGVTATLEALGRVCVPDFADWITLDLANPAGELERVVSRHADLALDAAAEPGRLPPMTVRPTLITELEEDDLRREAGDERHLRLLRAAGPISVMVLPIAARGRALGVMRLMTTRASGRYFRHDEFETGQELARRAAMAVDNARLLEGEQAARTRAEMLHAVSGALAEAVTREAVGAAVMREGAAALGAYAGVVALITEDGTELEILSSIGYRDCMLAGQRWPIGASMPIAEAARSAEPVYLESAQAWAARYAPGHPPSGPSAAWMALPLQTEAAPRGALLWTFDAARSFPPDDRALALALTRQCALALERTRLLEAERTERERAERAAERSRRMSTMVTALNQAITAQRVAEVIVEGGLRALGADAGSLALLAQDQGTWRVVHTVGFPSAAAGKWKTFPFTAGRPLSDSVMARTPLLLGGREEWESRYPAALAEVEQSGLVAYAALPIVSAGQAIAGLSFAFRTPRQFDEADRTFLDTLAEQCAQALERARLFDAERHARADAEAANRAKMDFLAVMSHELRTPLNAIGGYAELLEMGIRGPINDQQRADLERIRRSQRHLLSLINDVLNFAKLEAGHLDLAQEPLPMAELLADLEPLIGPQMSAKQLEYTVEACAPEIQAYADPEKVRQVLLNLISNAIKFTPPRGRVTVSCALREGVVEVGVRDTGVGVPADKLERIFDPFVQLDRAYTSGHEGTGLGLSISRDLSRAMGGDISVESEEGHGSTFILTLPRF
jgi:signal transduction histidine kinase